MRAYKCDDCGKLESGIATTVTGDGVTNCKDVGVDMDDFQSKLLDALLVRVSVARNPHPPDQECRPVELCAVCRAVAVIKAGTALAWDAGLDLRVEDNKLHIGDKIVWRLTRPK